MHKISVRLLNERALIPYAVANITKIPNSTFSDWKSGKNKPKEDKLIKIAECLGVPLEELIKDEDVYT